MNDLKQGIRDSFTLSIAVTLFGALFAVAAADKGLSFGQTMYMSAFVFAGSAQFTTLAVWGEQIPLLTVVVSAFLITSRNIFMGLSVGALFRAEPAWKRYPSLFIFGDLNYVLGIKAHHVDSKFMYMTGVGVITYSLWLVGTFSGVFLVDYLDHDVVESLAYGGIMFMGLLTILLVKSNVGFKLPMVTASIMSLMLYYWALDQAIIMIGAVITGGITNFWQETQKKDKQHG